jgi:hypothetical protein
MFSSYNQNTFSFVSLRWKEDQLFEHNNFNRHMTKSKNISFKKNKTKTKLHGLSPRANYTDRAIAACRQSDSQLVRIEGATWSL